MAGAILPIASIAHAGNVGISLNLGNVAFAYQDGYWDHSHRWHQWRSKHEAREYRQKRGHHYHNWNHDRDKDHGWRN
ncbi:MAG: hypothetical protein ACOH12_04460 [Parvibaculaceae bacterium]